MRRNSYNQTTLTSLSCFLLIFLLVTPGLTQKVLDHEDFGIWRSIEKVKMDDDGAIITYVLEAELLDPVTVIYDTNEKTEKRFDRSDNPSVSPDGSHIVFLTHPGRDDLRPFKRAKKKKDEWPSDTLTIYDTEKDQFHKIPDVASYSLPSQWNDWLLYELRPKAITKDSFELADKEGKKHGNRLVVRQLSTGTEDTLFFVKKYLLSEKSPYLAYYGSGGPDSSYTKGLFARHLDGAKTVVLDSAVIELHQWSWHDSLPLLGWISQPDSLKENKKAVTVYYSENFNAAQMIADSSEVRMPGDWKVSPHQRPYFSENGQRLFFGTAPVRMERDTGILDEEWPEVEVWHTEDQVLYTQQANRAERDKKRSFLAAADLNGGDLIQLGSPEVPYVRLSDEGNGQYALGIDDTDYQKYISWEGHDYNDIYLIDTRTGDREMLSGKIYGNVNWSPKGKYLYWYTPADSSWVIMDPMDKTKVVLGQEQGYIFTDEIHDIPLPAGSYGSPGWLEDDSGMLLYDRYDIWLIDPAGDDAPYRVTRGREGREVFRLIRRDPEQRAWKVNEPWMVWHFSESTKTSGYGLIDPSNWSYEWINDGPYSYSRRVIQARNTDRILFTRENFQEFPDLRISSFPFLRQNELISKANPQQEDYAWGSIELHKWQGPYGQEVEGLLVKPAGFDPDSTYPMIINFYEKSADGLNRHRHPYAHRSTINYAFYASRGYLIFNPDIHYTEGDPGKNALDHVNAGIDYLIPMGIVDTNRMALQGHSWGGYQIAYIIAHSDRFRCAESGAPVVNMVSAYGGIRWGTGLSRMFQYENTQSRLGETLWDAPERYLRNSPIFDMPKVNTPVLIMHNDNDGHVPWYQGIEFFVALRRLGKKAWMLNYNDEPHWPLKLANRLDFNKRMQQFFDHYLMDKEAPEWMTEGVPAVEKEFNLGY